MLWCWKKDRQEENKKKRERERVTWPGDVSSNSVNPATAPTLSTFFFLSHNFCGQKREKEWKKLLSYLESSNAMNDRFEHWTWGREREKGKTSKLSRWEKWNHFGPPETPLGCRRSFANEGNPPWTKKKNIKKKIKIENSRGYKCQTVFVL